MQRQGEHAVIALEDVRCAVALVYIQVNHRHLQRPALARMLRLQDTRCHSHIVEHAKTTAFVGVSVVRAAGQARADTPAQGRSRSRYRGPHRAACALGHGLTPRKPDLAHHGGIHRPIGNRRDIRRHMDQHQLGITGPRSLEQLNRR